VLRSTPFTGAYNGPLTFWRNEIIGSTYHSPAFTPRLTLAARTRLGSTFGEQRDDLPANRRFYAGGGGSIRGYEFEMVGPLDEDEDPLGGRSVAELGLELRLKVTEQIGVVPFFEGGNVFKSAYPDFSESLLWAAGLGLRYYTPVGPLRLDVAVPLDKRDDVDESFQFYISLGQAF
jgi:translocation and assembly module TamA